MIKPIDLGLPSRFKEFRPNQLEIIQRAAGSGHYAYLVDAPPGTGKSLIGVAVHEITKMDAEEAEVWAEISDKDLNDYKKRTIYITRTKQLQEQLLETFPKARTIMGRRNYPCNLLGRWPEVTADDCPQEGKKEDRPMQCLSCAYNSAKFQALRAPIAVLNTAYYLTEINGPGQFSRCRLLIVDEVDTLENELMNFIQFTVSERSLKRLEIRPPQGDKSQLKTWLTWAADIDYQLGRYMMDISDAMPGSETKWGDIELELNRKLKRLGNFRTKLAQFVNQVNANWVFSESMEKNEKSWTFKPVMVADYANAYLWQFADRVLGMSGTILDPHTVAGEVGLKDFGYERLQSQFPLENRPIYFWPAVNLTRGTMQEELPKLSDAVARIMAQYPSTKILVHTTSYPIRNYLQQQFEEYNPAAGRRGRVLTHDSTNRLEMLEAFKESDKPLVMLSPSFDRGVDLPDNICQCVIICKVPYLSMGDPQVAARMKLPGGQQWYLLKAVQTMIQMSGRAVRSPTDKCTTYILDKQFNALKARTRQIIPGWWLDAIQNMG